MKFKIDRMTVKNDKYEERKRERKKERKKKKDIDEVKNKNPRPNTRYIYYDNVEMKKNSNR